MGNWIYGYNGYGFTNDAGAYYGPDVSLNVDPSIFSSIVPGGEIVDFDIFANPPELSWEAVERTAYNWMSLTPGSGMGSTTIDVSVLANTGVARTGYIDVSANGVATKTITISQSAKTIYVDFEDTTTYLANTAAYQDGYRQVVITGMEAGDVLTLYYTHSAFIFNSDQARCYVKENAGSWVLENTRFTDGSNLENHPNVSNTDIIYLRNYAVVSDSDNDSCSSGITLTSATLTSGTGNVSVSGTTSFYCFAGTLPP